MTHPRVAAIGAAGAAVLALTLLTGVALATSAAASSGAVSSGAVSSHRASSHRPLGTRAAATANRSALSPSLAEGQNLFYENCSSCHGVNAGGGALGANLRGVGSATVDLWVSSGWMPLANPTIEPARKPALFDRQQTLDIANYVASLTKDYGPSVPTVDLSRADVSEGFSIFALNCGPCHTVTGAGDALSDGITAPPLHGVTSTMVEEAIRTGPGNMPAFGKNQLSASQVASVVAYVTRDVGHPDNPGGLGLGGVGPVAEGFIGLFVGVGACIIVAMWIGDRTEKEEPEDHAGPGGHVPSGDGREVAHG